IVFVIKAEDGIRYRNVTGVQTCALPICSTKEIEKANIKTIYTIQTYALEKKERIKEELALAESEPHSETRTRFIGLDIGTSHLVSASNIDMKDTYTCHRQGVKNCVRNYNTRMRKRPNKQ